MLRRLNDIMRCYCRKQWKRWLSNPMAYMWMRLSGVAGIAGQFSLRWDRVDA